MAIVIFSEEQESQICSDYLSGKNIEPIAVKFGCGPSKISIILDRHKIPKRHTAKRNILTDTQREEIIDLFTNGIKAKEIEQKMNIPCWLILRTVQEKDVKKADRRFYCPEQEAEILKRYSEGEYINCIAHDMKICPAKVKRFLLSKQIKIQGPVKNITVEQEKEIIRLYIEERASGKFIFELFGIGQSKFNQIIVRNGYKIRDNSREPIVLTIEQENEIIKLVKDWTNLKDIKSKLSFACNVNTIDLCVKKHFPYSGKRDKLFWKKYLSPEVYERRSKERFECLSKIRSGSNCYQWGKPPNKNSGYGLMGRYKEDHHFRSLPELMYLMYLDENNIKYENCESIGCCIQYVNANGNLRHYWPDFLVNNEKIVEIKPSTFQTNPTVLAKATAAKEYCADKGLTYEMLDIKHDNNKIKQALDAGFIKFGKGCEERFLKRFLKRSSKKQASS